MNMAEHRSSLSPHLTPPLATCDRQWPASSAEDSLFGLWNTAFSFLRLLTLVAFASFSFSPQTPDIEVLKGSILGHFPLYLGKVSHVTFSLMALKIIEISGATAKKVQQIRLQSHDMK